MENQVLIYKKDSSFYKSIYRDSFYNIYIFEGIGKLFIDAVEYNFEGRTILFTSPYQNIQIFSNTLIKINVIGFHSDFYCIEYHKNEVACNGLLFNNIYVFPHFSLGKKKFNEIIDIFKKMREINTSEDFSAAILKSYIQLILAICSQEKNILLLKKNHNNSDFLELKAYQNLVEKHFIREKSPSFYANLLNISPNTLSKKIKSEYGKTPSQIIQERVILEAKKLIHLTKKSIKEIAAELNFEDEHYFSKYFKKYTGISPTKFREETGISIVAK